MEPDLPFPLSDLLSLNATYLVRSLCWLGLATLTLHPISFYFIIFLLELSRLFRLLCSPLPISTGKGYPRAPAKALRFPFCQRRKSTQSGLATKIEEYAPEITPISIARAKIFVV